MAYVVYVSMSTQDPNRNVAPPSLEEVLVVEKMKVVDAVSEARKVR